MKTRERENFIIYALCCVAGAVFCLWYLRSAGADVVYSDYIRLIDEYLPDVTDPARFFVPDILTRTPVYFLQRAVNVKNFGYSVNFDRIFTVAGLCLMAFSLAYFSADAQVKPLSFAAMAVVLFSLSKWEVFMNGTCWPHVAAIGCFFLNYVVADRVWKGGADAVAEIFCCISPFLWLLVAGEYIASYAVTMLLLCLCGMMTGGASGPDRSRARKVFLRIFLCTFTALLLYLLSRSFAVFEHAGAQEMTLWELVTYAPSFLPKFFLKSLAGTVFGAETVANFAKGAPLPDIFVYLTGLTVLLGYGMAFYLYFSGRMYEKTVFPLLLLVSGLINHGLILAARWIFLNENYGMSSRYAVQFLIGILGILLVFALYQNPSGRARKKRKKGAAGAFLLFFTAFVCAGNLYTSVQEIQKAPYRKANYEQMAETILNYEDKEPEELCRVLEWHKDPETLLRSLTILKENSLNVFSPLNPENRKENE